MVRIFPYENNDRSTDRVVQRPDDNLLKTTKSNSTRCEILLGVGCGRKHYLWCSTRKKNLIRYHIITKHATWYTSMS